MKIVSVRQPPSMSHCPLLCHSGVPWDRSDLSRLPRLAVGFAVEAEGKDLRFAPSATNLERKTYSPPCKSQSRPQRQVMVVNR